jgi:phage baseplate assembly protein W
VLVRPDDLRDFIRDALHTHLGQFVIRRDFGRINHVSFLPIELLLDASIEEERDMCVLFRLYVQHVGKVPMSI